MGFCKAGHGNRVGEEDSGSGMGLGHGNIEEVSLEESNSGCEG